MEDVFDVCRYFIDRGVYDGRPVCQIRLQKLLYFSQGFHLADQERKLFRDRIYAWKYGPVVKTVYEELKHFGTKSIQPRNAKYGYQIPGDQENLSIRSIKFLNTIWKNFGMFVPFELVKMTHKTDSPWYKIAEAHNWNIPHDTQMDPVKMGTYFKQFIIPETKD